MNQTRNAHIFGLLATLTMQLAGVWTASDTDLVAKIAMSIAAAIAVLLPSPYQRRLVPVMLALIPVAAAVVTIALTKVTPKAAAFGILSTVSGVLTRLPALLPVPAASPSEPSNVVQLPPRDKQSGHAAPPPMIFIALLFTLCALAFFVAARCAKADEQPAQADTIGNWTQAWTVGGAALSFNLRDGAITAADQGGTCYSITNTRWHIGGDLCLYFRIATKGLPNAFTPTIGAHYRQAGLGFGLLKSDGDPLAPVLRLTGQLPILGGT